LLITIQVPIFTAENQTTNDMIIRFLFIVFAIVYLVYYLALFLSELGLIPKWYKSKTTILRLLIPFYYLFKN